MRKGLLASVALVLSSAGLARAQAPPVVVPGAVPAPTDHHAPAGPDLLADCDHDRPQSPCIWAGAEYLLWTLKDAPLPLPVVTTTTHPEIATPGAIGAEGTSVLYGGAPIKFGTFSGARVILGGWLDSDQRIGLEGNGFLLEQRSAFFNARSDANGNPFLGFPFYDPVAGAQGAIPVTYPPVPPPGFARGGITVASTNRLWGSEANVLFNVARRDALGFDLLGGFRYLDLQEGLTLTGNNFTTDSDGVSTVNVVGVDSFATRNQFYGGQLGARLRWSGKRLWLNLTGTVALGQTHQVLNVYGISRFINPTGDFVGTAPPTWLGNVYTQPTNLNRTAVNPFSAIPALQVKAGYSLTSRLTAYVGYDFLFWGNVIRPGNQIDPIVNLSQRFNMPLTGPPAPLPVFTRSSFWAQGVSFGLRFAF